MLGPRR
ncbi:unnamed protein product [Linum tenue]|nr:unnamed protein product [Linum tenue]CAI0429091.1 unnamed protein product [Linum tenue]CAI0429184.1 unnamed protein product [Linum tenue]CAI0429192.1 unnamed protein product [Linum tenue]